MAGPGVEEIQRLTNSIKITDSEFQSLRSLIYDRCGIHLTDQKKGLLVTRLNKILKTLSFSKFDEYYRHVLEDKTGKSLSDLVDAVSTNHTYFYREEAHFDFLRQEAFPQVVSQIQRLKQPKDLRMWCCASSTGEEPYTLAFLLMEFLKFEYSDWKGGVLATDISKTVIQKAQRGIYTAEQVSKVPQDLRKKYFDQRSGGDFVVKPLLKKEVTYRCFNLMNEQFPFRKPFHIIFCRNVMIYFDQPTVEQLVNKLHQWLVPGGYLFIGHAESLRRIEHKFAPVCPAGYKKI